MNVFQLMLHPTCLYRIMPRRGDWLRNYLDTVVSRSEAPERFHWWVGASIIGGALRRHVYINMETFQWFPNLYVILVGPPGIVKKSTTINVGARLLRNIPGVNFGADISTWEGFVQQLDDAKDIHTPQMNGAKLDLDTRHSISCALTMTVSEWGTFFDPKNRQMVEMLTDLYDGKTDIPTVKFTKTQGTNFISNPFVNIIAGTTPLWLRDNFKSNFAGWGLSSRCVFMHCLEPEREIPYPDEVWNGMYHNSMGPLRDDLKWISDLHGECKLTKGARAFGHEWYPVHIARKRSLDADPYHDEWLSYYLARKWDHINKLAIILSVSQRNDLLIDENIMREAEKRCNEVEAEMGRVFGGAAATQHSIDGDTRLAVWKGLTELMTRRADGRVNSRDAYSFCLPYMDWRQFEALIKQLTAAGWIEASTDAEGVWYRHPITGA